MYIYKQVQMNMINSIFMCVIIKFDLPLNLGWFTILS